MTENSVIGQTAARSSRRSRRQVLAGGAAAAGILAADTLGPTRPAVAATGGKVFRGSEQVGTFEHAIGGRPSDISMQRSREELQRFFTERARARRETQEEMARLLTPGSDLVLGHVGRDGPELAELLEAVKAKGEQRSRHVLRPVPRGESLEARLRLGSIQAIKAPPYDVSWTAGAVAAADQNQGTYSMSAESLGTGSDESAAGVAVWFLAPADNAQQRFAVALDYSDVWWDIAAGYVAYNDFVTRLWVWGSTEQKWVIQTDVSPQWNDGASWFDQHGNYPQGDAGGLTVETWFPAEAQRWYLAYIWSDAYVYSQSGFGSSASSIQFAASVPLMVFGDLSL